MAKKVVIQAGHINCAYNSIVSLRRSTGAPGEQEVTKRIADRLSALLRERGIDAIQTDANANDDKVITSNDYDLFLSLHCDADYAGDNGSGFADYPEPSTDGATGESQRICKIINDFYFPEVQIVYRNLSNANTRYFYMWKYLTAKTPCVLIEMGQCQDPHDRILLSNTDLIANALGRCICKAFDVPFDITPPQPPVQPPIEPPIEPPVQPPTETPNTPPVVCECPEKEILEKAKAVIWGKGFWWTKIWRLKELLSK